MNHEILDLGLVYYREVIDSPQTIIDLIEDVDRRFRASEHGANDTIVADWKPWTYDHLFFNYQKFFPEAENVPANDYYAKEMIEIANALYPSLNKAFDHYSKVVYPFAGRSVKAREYSIHLLKYGVGGHLPAHSDQGISTRVLSSVMYLNDDYEGGEIEFINSGVRIKPQAGSVIFFPSNFLYVHEVHPITDGFRYSMPHWYHNRKDFIASDGTE
jgi:Rps23 Pro-64 3,4-dihydroxylase Tpa1-like proline 4-hydroxylase